jgi:putative SbcD/Mre11-related phosphoesterase
MENLLLPMEDELKDIQFIEDCYLVFIKSLNALIMGDLHLGFEGVSAKEGVYLPKLNLSNILKQIEKAVKKIGRDKIQRMIILGDIKNEFDEIAQEEIDELFDFVYYTRNNIFKREIEMILVKGNHDNYVDGFAKSLNLKVYRQELIINDYLMFHGEEIPSKDLINKANFLILAHEHPSIGLYSEVGAKTKVKCFLYGKHKNKKILVLPAISYYAQGTEINLIPKEELLSPFLKIIDIDEMIPIVVDYEILTFPKIKYLRKI